MGFCPFEKSMDCTGKIGAFLNQFHRQKFGCGESLNAGEELTSVAYYLVDGNVKEYTLTHNGDAVMTSIYSRGAFFPVCVFCRACQLSTYLEAVSGAEIIKVPLTKLQEFMVQNPEIFLEMANGVADDVSQTLRRMTLFTGACLRDRIVIVLKYLSDKLGRTDTNTGKRLIDCRITHREIAAWTASTRESTSVEMKKLKDMGVISYEKQMIVVNEAMLSRELVQAD